MILYLVLCCRVSFYEMSVNDSVRVKQKSSGVTVCTGTGSTSWHFNINHAARESVADILKIGQNLIYLTVTVNSDLRLVSKLFSFESGYFL